MTYLDDLVEAFKREVAVPGAFASEFPDTTDEDLEAALADAFGHAQLDGFFGGAEVDLDTMEITPDLTTAGAALVVIYAGTRMIRAKLRNLAANRRYKAGPVEMETGVATALLVQELKDLQKRLDNIILNATVSARATTTFVLDLYPARMTAAGYGGFASWEMPLGSPRGLLSIGSS